MDVIVVVLILLKALHVIYLRQQLIILKRTALTRPRLKATDRLIFVFLYRLFPSLLDASGCGKVFLGVDGNRGNQRCAISAIFFSSLGQ